MKIYVFILTAYCVLYVVSVVDRALDRWLDIKADAGTNTIHRLLITAYFMYLIYRH